MNVKELLPYDSRRGGGLVAYEPEPIVSVEATRTEDRREIAELRRVCELQREEIARLNARCGALKRRADENGAAAMP